MSGLSNRRDVEEASLREILARYAPRVKPLRVESLGNRGGFSGAAIWRVSTDAGDFALRRWPSPGLPSRRIRGLHRLLEHLRTAGVSFVAVPLPTNDGTTLPRTAGHDWQLEPWLPGLADFREHSSRERLRAAMASLAQWHLAANRFVPNTACAEWFTSHAACPVPAVGERLAFLEQTDRERLGTMELRTYVDTGLSPSTNVAIRELSQRVLDLFQRGLGRVVDDLRLVRHVTVRLQPCLRDVWHDHVLFVGNEVAGLIDPAACRTESVASDLSRLIGSLVQDDRAAWDFALAEYQRHRPLSTNELALIPILDRSGVLLSGWTWLEWLHVERRSFPDADSALKRLSEIAERMKRLDSDGQPKLVIGK